MWICAGSASATSPKIVTMSTELGIALVLGSALLWMAVTLTILSAIDRPERKARRQERREIRTAKRRVHYRPAVAGSRVHRHSHPRRLHPH